MPYAIGLQSAANAFLSAGFATQFTIAVITLLSILLITSAFQKDAPDAPVSLPGMSLFHIMPFYRRRFDFLNWGIHATGQSIFQLKLLRNTVVVVSGESGRQAFFYAKGLDLTEGFKILSGAIPNVSGVTTDLQSRRIITIHKRVAAAQREGHLNTLLPHLLEDSRRVMERWGTSGKFDPFEKIYELTFQTTIRALSCGEIADDHVLVSRIKKLYDKLDTGTTPATILMPWLPSWTMVSKLWFTKEIYDIVAEAVEQRQELLKTIGEGEKPQDTMQLLLDAGDDKLAVVGFIMGLLIAGARATGTSASWLVTFLACHPEWARKARAEVESLVAAHTNVQYNSSTNSDSGVSARHPQASPGLATVSDITSPVTLSCSGDPSLLSISSPPTSSPFRPASTTATPATPAIVTNFPSSSTSGILPITPTPPISIRAPTSPLIGGTTPLSLSSSPLSVTIPSPTIPTSWSSRRQSYHQAYSYSYFPHTPSPSDQLHHQRRDSQSSISTLKGKRKRCNSGSGSDGDSEFAAVRREGRESVIVTREEPQRVGFPDSDGEKEKETRAFGGPISLLGDGSGRRRKDAITVASKKGLSHPRDSDSVGFATQQVTTPMSLATASPTAVPVPTNVAPSPHSTPRPLSSSAPLPSISQTLTQIPLTSWESSTPILDALIKETLRVAQPHTAMRRNVGPEFYIDGKRIETGSYVVYPFSDVHLNEDIYENADAWLPGRWLSEEGSKLDGGKDSVPFGYVGWGGGKSMCLGTRLAKVELKLIISMFVLGFNSEVVDKKGNPKRPDEMPSPNWNDILLCRPERKGKGEFWLGYERREGMVL